MKVQAFMATCTSQYSSVATDPGIHILLVDDEACLLDIGQVLLEKFDGTEVTTALSAQEALDLMGNARFDAIISDYQMPGMDGIEFLKMVRKKSTIPFILFTGRGREEIIIEAINNGADFYFQKGGNPKVQFAELIHTVRKAVRQQRSENALKEKHDIISAILAASPHGIGFVRDRTFQWVNDSLARMLGYTGKELIGMHLINLYKTRDVYEKIGEQIQTDLKQDGRSRVITRFFHKDGFPVDCEIHIAPLDKGNIHFGHMIMITDLSHRSAGPQEIL